MHQNAADTNACEFCCMGWPNVVDQLCNLHALCMHCFVNAVELNATNATHENAMNAVLMLRDVVE